jgi:hypothetical protein
MRNTIIILLFLSVVSLSFTYKDFKTEDEARKWANENTNVGCVELKKIFKKSKKLCATDSKCEVYTLRKCK